MPATTSEQAPVLIAGGYGTVGLQLARAFRALHPDVALLLGGRDPAKAPPEAKELGGLVRLDTSDADPLAHIAAVRAVVTAVNDPGDNLLRAAIARKVPFLDIARWTARVRQAAEVAKGAEAPVLLASGWMAGTASLLATAVASKMVAVEEIDISVLYYTKDKAGPDSVEYMDRLSVPFTAMRSSREVTVQPLSDPREVAFPSGLRRKAYIFDTPDALLLPKSTGAGTVSVRIAFDDAWMTWGLASLVRSGIWGCFSGDRWKSLRRGLLYSPGPGAPHEIVVHVRGGGEEKTATALDSLGQTHMTAVGAAVQLERLLGLGGAKALGPGVWYPDTELSGWERGLKVMKELGVEVSMGTSV
ncbi:saccharopine dehydrogenase [Hyaloraphidium curvatum]|nr:saccharopine dehydrogenase [Hyaloraphidium curvatum]